MQYYRNSELAKLYSVSRRTVGAWVKSVHDGKLDLQLFEKNGHFYIANTIKNINVIEKLVEKGKKYKNSRGQKVVQPTQKFYETYSRKQIFEIINYIEDYREAPRQYSFFADGARAWNEHSYRLWGEKTPNSLNSSIDLLNLEVANLDRLLSGYKYVNVIDIGPGNSLPVKNLLAHLTYDTKKLARYIAIDFSKEVLSIAQNNIYKWFGGDVDFKGYIRDVAHECFDDIVADNSMHYKPEETANVLILFSEALATLRNPDDYLRNIYNSVNKNDIIVSMSRLDSEQSRRNFYFNQDAKNNFLQPIHNQLVKLIGLDDSLYEVKTGFSQEERCRFISIKLHVAVNINFEFANINRTIELQKGEEILIWRSWHQSIFEVIDQFKRTGFTPLQLSTTQNAQYALTMSSANKKSMYKFMERLSAS